MTALSSAQSSAVLAFHSRRDELMALPDSALCDVADRYLRRKRIDEAHERVVVKACGKAASGIKLRWAERSAIANLISYADQD